MEEQEKKKLIVVEWHTKNWIDHKGTFDSNKYKKYNTYKRLISALCKKSYGIVVLDDKMYLRKVVGGIINNGKKAIVIQKNVDLKKIKKYSLQEQLTFIDNLFN